MAQEDSLPGLKKRINTFCEKLLPKQETIGKVRSGKIIHDATWGTQRFEKHEVEIIDTPLFQRLRGLNQMGFVDYVYPSARHSRFEHSLGVAVLASKMIDAVLSKDCTSALLDENVKRSIRLSALLHDVGHCMFSHTSELIYGVYLDGYIEEEFKDDHKKPSPHEFFSYLIVTSKSFREFFETICDKYSLCFDLDEIASRIVGRSKSRQDKYKTDFINGPIDADKLDYFHRDSQFSGIPIQLDIDRLLQEISISQIPIDQKKAVRTLTVSTSGITCIEQFIFNKMILYSTIYSHHKVEAIDCMLKGIFEYIMNNHICLNIGDTEREIKYPDDFLYLSDSNLFALADSTRDCELKRLINNIRRRHLLKRAFVISRKTLIKEWDEITPSYNEDLLKIVEEKNLSVEEKLYQIKSKLEGTHSHSKVGMSGILNLLDQGANKLEKHNYLRGLAKKIFERAMQISKDSLKCKPYEIWIDMPKSPSSEEIQDSMMVRANREVDGNFKSIDKYFPFPQYKDLYENNRLNGYVFAPEDSVEVVSIAAKDVLEKSLGIKFNNHAFRPSSTYSH